MTAMTVGFIGTGKITTALVTGFATRSITPRKIIVSPRNAERAAALSQQFSMVEIATDNQAVIDATDVIFLALRPETAEAVLSGLEFRENLPVISLMPTVPLSLLKPMIHPTATISRAVPLPSAAKGFGPVLLFAPHPVSQLLIGAIGDAVEVESEEILHGLWTVNGMISPVFDMMAEMAGWARAQGVPESLARLYTARFVETIAKTAVVEPDVSFAQHSHDAATPGGLNEQTSRMLAEAQAWRVWTDALNAVRKRFPD